MGRIAAPALALTLAACGDDTGGASGSTTSLDSSTSATTQTTDTSTTVTTAQDGSSSSAGGTSSGGTSATDGSSGGTKLDLAVPDTRQPPTGCDMVDFLFVIDNSSSMEGYQQKLLGGAFGLFMEQIQGTLQAQDYHVMVVDSDADEGIVYCQTQCDTMGELCTGVVFDFPCPVAASACDGTLGAGVIQPFGQSATNGMCEFDAPARYLASGMGDLVDAFTCAATVGTSGSNDQRNMNAMLAAVGPELAAPGACNEGFLREDAMLVVTILSDATAATSQEQVDETPQAWHDALIAAKDGYDGAVVVLGLVADADLDDGVCQPNPIPAEGSPELRAFVDTFGERGIFASICEPDYQPFFGDAVTVIDTTCDEFVPRG
jgi:hypothetical protein